LNTQVLWEELFEKEINVRKDIIIPGRNKEIKEKEKENLRKQLEDYPNLP
jgi:hypothetical protein